MDRKLNLARIAIQNTRKIRDKIASPVRVSEQNANATESPFFSPLKTRNQRKLLSKNAAKSNASLLQQSMESPLSTAVRATISNNSPPSTSGAKAKKPTKKRGAVTIKKEVVDEANVKLENDGKNVEPVPIKGKRQHIKIEYDEIKPVKLEPIEDVDEKPAVENKKAKKRDHLADTKPSVSIKEESTTEATTDSKQSKWEPKHFKEMLDNIRKMRMERQAPVDTMGCHKCADVNTDPKIQRFHHLIALMLSSQTKDTVTYEAMNRLKAYGLTPQKMVEIKTAELEKLLYPVGFYRTKAKNIKSAAQILIEKFDSDIPNDIKGLVSLPGVGPKMGHICMRVAWNVVTGIGVDTHGRFSF